MRRYTRFLMEPDEPPCQESALSQVELIRRGNSALVIVSAFYTCAELRGMGLNHWGLHIGDDSVYIKHYFGGTLKKSPVLSRRKLIEERPEDVRPRAYLLYGVVIDLLDDFEEWDDG